MILTKLIYIYIPPFQFRQASDLYNKQEKLVNDLETQQRVLSYLEQKLAPQVMVGRAKKERHPLPVSHQTIYNFIYQHKRNWISYLPYRKSRKYNYRKSRKNIAHVTKTNICYREKSANKRSEIGHYEIDTIHLDEGGILTMVDRKSRYLAASLLPDLKSNTSKQYFHLFLK